MKHKRYYFIGIGGIGMSSIARYLLQQGEQVGGYDKTPSEITAALVDLGAIVTFDASEEAIPVLFQSPDTFVVYTPAIPKKHPQLVYFTQAAATLMKRAEFLGILTKNIPTIAVAGTHGKTTTTAILTHLFSALNQNFTAFIGGVLNAQTTNLISTGMDTILVEADEFDRSFLHLHPTQACITSVDADHLDIYGDSEKVEEAYHQFSNQVSRPCIVAMGVPIEGLTYAVEQEADYSALSVKVEGFGYRFDLKTPTRLHSNLYFSQLGGHNLNNALAAFALGSQFGLDEEKLGHALASFRGVHRRFQCILENEQNVLLDDYAHHPTEIKAVLVTLRDAFPADEICVIFQPHLYTRTRDFIEEFAMVLSQFDRVVLAPIYPARELPIEGITSAVIASKINKPICVEVKTKAEIRNEVSFYPERIKVVLGAGDIGLEVAAYQKKLMEA